MARGCARDDAEPIFTAPLSSIKKGYRDTRQPQWYCEKHRKKHHRVSATSGRRVQKVGALHRTRVVREVMPVATVTSLKR